MQGSITARQSVIIGAFGTPKPELKLETISRQSSKQKSAIISKPTNVSGAAAAIDVMSVQVVEGLTLDLAAPRPAVKQGCSMQAFQPVLNTQFWAQNLPKVLPTCVADQLLSLLTGGVRIGRPPADQTIISKNWPSSALHKAQVNEVIAKDLAAGRLHGPFDIPPYSHYIVSPLGAFPKRDSTKIRVIHDLSFPVKGSVNSLINADEFTFSYSSVDDAARCCRSLGGGPVFMSKLDLQDAYKHVFIDPLDWHLMGFSWPGQDGVDKFYFSKVLNFGLRSAPYLFDLFADGLERFMKARGVTHNLVRYVDDFLVLAESASDCQHNLDLMLTTCTQAGFSVQPSKITSPHTKVEFLGIVIDTDAQILRISAARLQELKQEATGWMSSKVMSKRHLLSLLGKLSFASRVVRQGRAFLGRLFSIAKSARALHHRVKLNPEALADLEWWVTCIESHNGISYYNPDWSVNPVHIFSDSSGASLGACAEGEWFAISFSGTLQHVAGRSINWKEFFAAVLALNTWAPRFHARCIIFHIDNTTVCHILNNMYSPVSDLMYFVRHWALIVEHHNLSVAPVYISTHDNKDADDLSRMRLDSFKARNPNASPHMTWPDMSFFNVHV